MRALIIILTISLGFGLVPEDIQAGSSRVKRRQAKEMFARSKKLADPEALQLLKRADKLSPNNVKIIYRTGFLYHKMNYRKQARSSYVKTLRLKKCHVKALNNLAGLELDQGRKQQARKLYARGIRCNKRFYLSYYNLGGLYQSEKNYSKALRYYRAGIKRNRKHARSYHNLGTVYYQLAQKRPARSKPLLKKALSHLNRACKLKPKDALCRYNRGKTLYQLERSTEARQAFLAAERLTKRPSRLHKKIRRYLKAL